MDILTLYLACTIALKFVRHHGNSAAETAMKLQYEIFIQNMLGSEFRYRQTSDISQVDSWQ